VRELENAMERAMVLCETHGAQPRDLDPSIREPADPIAASSSRATTPSRRPRASSRRSLIRRALEKTKGNRTRAAELLEISHRALLYKIKDYSIR
jgi:two-component system response regulator AtoC